MRRMTLLVLMSRRFKRNDLKMSPNTVRRLCIQLADGPGDASHNEVGPESFNYRLLSPGYSSLIIILTYSTEA